MKCYRCGRHEGTIIVPSLERKACAKCFAEIIERRFRKTLRDLRIKSARVIIKRPSDEVLAYLLSRTNVKPAGRVKQFTLDDLAVSILKSFLTGRDCVLKGRSPLESISEKELITYSRINKLAFKGNPRTGIELHAHELLMKLDQRRPGVMFSLRDFMKKII